MSEPGLQTRVQTGEDISEIVSMSGSTYSDFKTCLVPFLDLHNRCFPLIVSSADRNIWSSAVISRATKNNLCSLTIAADTVTQRRKSDEI